MARVVRKKGKAAERLRVALKEIDGIEAKVGWFESARYEDGTPVALVAAVQENGYAPGGIPPRPFMRPTVEQEQENWKAQATSGAKAVMSGNISLFAVMDAIALGAVGSVQKTIAGIHEPPLQQSTIQARKLMYSAKNKNGDPTKPLIATGHMIRTMTAEVTKK